MLTLHLTACKADTVLPLAITAPQGMAAHTVAGDHVVPASLPPLSVGTVLRDPAGTALLRCIGRTFLPARSGCHMLECPLVQACTAISAGTYDLHAAREGIALAWITLSDKGSRGQRDDESGPLIEEMVQSTLPLRIAHGFLIPDDAAQLRALLTDLALHKGYDLIITTGGTGVGPRDFTPQTTAKILDMELPGFAQAMMQASLAKTPRAVISRAMAGTLGRALIINLPGSKKAVRENLEAVLPALGHTIEKLQGDPSDCGA